MFYFHPTKNKDDLSRLLDTTSYQQFILLLYVPRNIFLDAFHPAYLMCLQYSPIFKCFLIMSIFALPLVKSQHVKFYIKSNDETLLYINWRINILSQSRIHCSNDLFLNFTSYFFYLARDQPCLCKQFSSLCTFCVSSGLCSHRF